MGLGSHFVCAGYWNKICFLWFIMATTPTINWTLPIAFGGSGGGGVISGTTVPTDATGADGQVYQLLNANGSVVALYTRASLRPPPTNGF